MHSGRRVLNHNSGPTALVRRLFTPVRLVPMKYPAEREVTVMEYRKPQIVEIGNAIGDVENTSAKIHIVVDVLGWVTIAAYQSDEK